MKAEAKRNITLSLPVSLIQQLKVLAAQREVSMSALITRQLQDVVPSISDRQASAERLIELMSNSQSYGVVGKEKWSREDAYDHLER